LNILGIDFEDWYHPELIQRHIKSTKHEPTVINGLDKILELLRKNNTYATFFVVGELLESKPELLDKIIENGHEIGFHTMHHTRIDLFENKEKFVNEIHTFTKITNGKSKGFRAPTFSLNQKSAWTIDVLSNEGYIYDSSVVPAKTSMYGIPNAESRPYKISSSSLEKNDPNGKLIEFPLLTTTLFGKKIPAGGGFYIRFLPNNIINSAITNYEKNNIPATFYIHSWELTPEFMKKIHLPFKDSFITYYNLQKTFSRMEKLLQKFKFTSFTRYLQSKEFTLN
jgi:polysaccharide deacetylase family protein (PEP-CTERM system associated)